MNYYAVVFLLRPHIYYAVNPSLTGEMSAIPRRNGVGTRCAAIVNLIHYAIENLLRRANLLRRSIFSTAGSFGYASFTLTLRQPYAAEIAALRNLGAVCPGLSTSARPEF